MLQYDRVPAQLARSPPQGWTAAATKGKQKGSKGSDNTVKLTGKGTARSVGVLTFASQPLPSLLFTNVDLASADRKMHKTHKVRDSRISHGLEPAEFSQV